MPKTHQNPDTIHRPHNDAYSHVVVVEGGRLAVLAGQAALDEEGNIVGGVDVFEQARQAFLNLRAALEAVGAGPSDIVKLTTFVVGHAPSQLAALAAARSEVLDLDEPPASTLVGVHSLAIDGLLVEVEALALLD